MIKNNVYKTNLCIFGIIFVIMIFLDGYFLGNAMNNSDALAQFMIVFGCLFIDANIIAYLYISYKVNKDIVEATQIKTYTLKDKYHLVNEFSDHYLVEDFEALIKVPKHLVKEIKNDIVCIEKNIMVFGKSSIEKSYKTKLLIDYNSVSGFVLKD